MALKASESFIRFVTMGAAGTHRAIEVLRGQGHAPSELERYATCNKIWQTKIKRLRMADLFCLRCGARFEVRAKSKFEIKMSDSPTVQDREWDAGLRDEDTVLFVPSRWVDEQPVPSEHVEAFEVRALRETSATSTLGPAKSAGEGAERDRRWPTIVGTQDGVVKRISQEAMQVEYADGRLQTLRLQRKEVRLTPYLAAGDRFAADCQFLAGTPERKATLACPGERWRPGDDLASTSPMTRFTAVKGIGLLGLSAHAQQLQQIAAKDPDPRVQLEAVGALLRLQQANAERLLLAAFDNPAREDLRMEAVLIAGEIRTEPARTALQQMLGREAAADDEELRAAIIWSLGAYGCGDVDAVMDHLGDASDVVASHAAVAVGVTLKPHQRQRLFECLRGSTRRVAASAAWVLEHASTDVLPHLLELAETDPDVREWAIAILGRRDPTEVVPLLEGKPELMQVLQPWWLMARGENWLSEPGAAATIRFVSEQTLTQRV